jgi:thymidylate synthase
MKQYQDLLRHVLENGEAHGDRTGVGTTSVFGHQMAVDLRTSGFPMVTLRKLPFRWIASELIWMLRGSTDERELSSQGVRTWAPWATAQKCAEHGRSPGDLGPTYGHLIRKFGSSYMPLPEHNKRLKQAHGAVPERMIKALKGVDQLWDLCLRMDTEPNSRRLIVSQWDPTTVDRVTVPPCHPLWQVKLHEPPVFVPSSNGHNTLSEQQGISMHVYQRSADAAVGLAFDLAHYALLLCMLGWCTSRQPRRLVFSFGDLHIYNNHRPMVQEMLSREPRQPPSLMIDKEMWHATPGSPGTDTFVNMLQFTPQHLSLVNYYPHPAIKAEVAV